MAQLWSFQKVKFGGRPSVEISAWKLTERTKIILDQ